MKDDAIYRQDAIDALDKRFESIPMELTTEILMLRKDLRELPSAQPEDRCGECDAWNQYKNYPRQPEIIHCKECMNHGKEICYFWSHFYGTINTPDDGFCHKAERRTDD